MKRTNSRTSAGWWLLLSLGGGLGCDRAADLGAYIGGHARSEQAASSPAAAEVELPRSVATASATAVAGAAPSYPPSAATTAPPAPGGVATAPAASSSERSRASALSATAKVAEQQPAGASAEHGAHPIAGAKPAEIPSASATPKTGGLRNASVGGGAVSGGNVSNAARVIAGLRAPLRSCYASDPSSAPGSLRFSVAVGASGAVASVSSARSGGLSDRLVACATSAVQHVQFASPDGGKAVIAFPVTFFEQDPAPPKRTTL